MTATLVAQPIDRATIAHQKALLVSTLLDRVVLSVRRYRTRRALRALSSSQRQDCGLSQVDVPSACQIEAAARRRLELRMPTEWC